MNLKQLRYFVAVAEELHFSRAAARLAVSQPPLSQQIMALETELGVRLFTRSKRSVALTATGSQWLPEVKRLLAEAEALPELARRLHRGETGSLSLAFVSSADYGLLPGLLRHFQQRHGGVRLRLQEATSDLQLQALERGEIDAGILIPPRQLQLPPELVYQPLHREALVLALPAAWLASGRIPSRAGQVAFADIQRQPLILFPRHSAPDFFDAITGLYRQHQAQPLFGQGAIQMQTIISIVSAEMGVALVPASLQNLQRSGVAYLPLAETSPQIETGLLYRRAAKGAALSGLIAAAEAAAGELPGKH